MTVIYLLTDYKNRFGSKWNSSPYRSGFDHHVLAEAFATHGYAVEFIPCAEVLARPRSWEGQLVLYTSSEEIGNTYKIFIEDIVYGLSEAGAQLLPRAAFLRANNNKVFMEVLRDQILGEDLSGLKSRCFGTIEELAAALEKGEIAFPCVLKPSYGAMSQGVTMAKSADEALRRARELSRTPHLRYELRDYLRSKKLPGYLRESRHQSKFIVQPLIPQLAEDYKVLVYGDQYYVLRRGVPPGDFRASGSHYNYQAGRQSGVPEGVLNFVERIYNKFSVPHLSVDIVFDGRRSYLIEFQAVYFGTTTHAKFSEEYFIRKSGKWQLERKAMNQEEVFAYAVAHYLGHQRGSGVQPTVRTSP